MAWQFNATLPLYRQYFISILISYNFFSLFLFRTICFGLWDFWFSNKFFSIFFSKRKLIEWFIHALRYNDAKRVAKQNLNFSEIGFWLNMQCILCIHPKWCTHHKDDIAQFIHGRTAYAVVCLEQLIICLWYELFLPKMFESSFWYSSLILLFFEFRIF